jgi:cytochrome bd-type quinol oxidase subunit 2
VCAVALTLLHTAAGYLVLLAYAAGTASPWERDAAAHSGFAAGAALAVVLVSAPLTRVFVRAGWLRGWWYALPAVLAAAALLRLTLLVPEQRP